MTPLCVPPSIIVAPRRAANPGQTPAEQLEEARDQGFLQLFCPTQEEDKGLRFRDFQSLDNTCGRFASRQGGELGQVAVGKMNFLRRHEYPPGVHGESL